MLFNATCYNFSVISWLSVLLVMETGISGGNHPLFDFFNKILVLRK